jgi:hypothetical protein
MSARKKLNSAFLNGSFLVAGLVGAAAGSWLIFGLAVAVLIGNNICAGNIRLNGRKR